MLSESIGGDYDNPLEKPECPPTRIICADINNLGDTYSGVLIYDVDTIQSKFMWPDVYEGGVPFYALFFDSYVLYGDIGIGVIDYIYARSESISFTDEVPTGAGSVIAAEYINFGLGSPFFWS